MHLPSFFKLFPPPGYMAMKYCGLDISDDAIRFIEYSHGRRGFFVSKYDEEILSRGLVEGGDIKDEAKFSQIISAFINKNHINKVKVSIPEEKAYLFQTDVPNVDRQGMAESIEFKMEENVPLSGKDALFSFDIFPGSYEEGNVRVNVTAVPRTYIDKYIKFFHDAGCSPVAFETVPKAVTKAVSDGEKGKTKLIINCMNYKTGFYIAYESALCFASTLSFGGLSEEISMDGMTKQPSPVEREVSRTISYWNTKGIKNSPISEIILVGKNSGKFLSGLSSNSEISKIPTKTASVWANAFDAEKNPPAISKEQSLDFAVAAGLAMIN